MAQWMKITHGTGTMGGDRRLAECRQPTGCADLICRSAGEDDLSAAPAGASRREICRGWDDL